MEYRTGDRVEILIGQPVWIREKMVDGKVVMMDEVEWIDLSPELVGRKATIVLSTRTQGVESVSLDIDGVGIVSWFGLNQIKKLTDVVGQDMVTQDQIKRFVEVVGSMRKSQREYFRTRNNIAMMDAKELEKSVDKAVIELKELI